MSGGFAIVLLLLACQQGAPGSAREKLVVTELEGRFRDASFWCARWNDVAGERSLSPPCEGDTIKSPPCEGGTIKTPPCEGGVGGVVREPWESRTILLASR